MMINHKAQLEAISSKIKEWANEVPSPAKRFHEASRALLNDVDERVNSWWGGLFLFSAEIDALQRRARALDDAKSELIKLLMLRSTLLTSLEELKRVASGLKQHVRTEILNRCEKLEEHMIKSGAAVVTLNEVKAEHHQVEEIAKTVKNARDAANLFSTADSLLSPGGLDGLDRQVFETVLEPLFQEFISDGATIQLIARLETAVNTAQGKLKGPIDTSVSVDRDSDAALYLQNVLRRWAEVVDGHENNLKSLIRSADRKGLEQRIESYRDQADVTRTQLLTRIHSLARSLADVSEPNDRIRMEIEKLEQVELVHPEDWTEFENRYKTTYGRLVGLAETDRDKLYTYFISQMDSLQESLRGTRQKLHSMTNDKRAEELESEIFGLRRIAPAGFPPNPDQILEALGKCSAFKEQVRHLDNSIDEDLHDFVNSRDRVKSEFGSLKPFYEYLNVELPVDWSDVVGKLGGVSERASPRWLDDYRLALANAESRWAAYRDQLHQEVVRRIQAIAAYCSEAINGLMAANQRIDAMPSELRNPGSLNVSDLRRASAVAEEYFAAVKQTLDRAVESMLNEAAELSKSLLAVKSAPNAVHRSELDRTEDLLCEFKEQQQPQSGIDAIQRLKDLTRWMQDANALLGYMRQQEVKVHETRKALQRRLKMFEQDMLHVYHSRYLDRLRALVYGIPDQPPYWPHAMQQLDNASLLFDQIEQDARRHVGQELVETQAFLTKKLQNRRLNADLKRRIEQAMELLDPVEMPRRDIRLRLQTLKDESTRQ